MIGFHNHRLEISRTLTAPEEHLWRIVTDTRLWTVWGPSVRAVDCPDRYIGPLSSGRIQTPVGLWLPFAITGFTPGRFWSWRIGRFAATGHRLVARGPESCDLVFDMPWWALFYLPVCWYALGRIARLADRRLQL